MSSTETRPTAVNAAFWALVGGAVLLMSGGLMAATVSFDYLRESVPSTISDESVRNYGRMYRGAGILFCLAAAALSALAVRARTRDLRFRRAVMSLGLAIVVLVALAAAFGFSTILALLSLVPIVTGTLLLSRASVVDWYANG